MTTTQDMMNYIKAEAKRGNTLDDVLLQKLVQAVRSVERLHTFLHMEHYADFIISTTSENPRSIPQPAGLKKVRMMRIVYTPEQRGGFEFLHEIAPQDLSTLDGSPPTASGAMGSITSGLTRFRQKCSTASLPTTPTPSSIELI